MFESQKNAFWVALILSVFVFAGGILLGFMLENWRTSDVQNFYAQSEISLLDVKTQNELFSLSDINCPDAIKANIDFADRVYGEAKLLEKYEQSSRLSDALVLQHKKYDLLRALFWINSVELKKRCNANYHTIVYLYDYDNPRLDIKAKQQVFSNILQSIKQTEGDNVMLIPMAGDNNLVSISLMMKTYNITEQELPVILIDEKTKITQIESIDDIKRLL